MKISSGSWPSHQGGKHERAFMNARSAPAHAYTCHSEATLLNAYWLSSPEIRVKVEIFQLKRISHGTNPRERARLCTAKVWRDKSNFRWFSLAKNSPDTRLYVHFVWDLVARRVWCERTNLSRLGKAGQNRQYNPRVQCSCGTRLFSPKQD